MALLKDWQKQGESYATNKQAYTEYWNRYFDAETKMYASLLEEQEPLSGTVAELAEHFHVDLMYMTGFLDGINDSLKEANPINEMEADTVVSLDYDKEKLYYNMCGAKADWLYNLPQWDALLPREKRDELFKAERASHTIVRKGPKVGRNDPCPCGSGKKYKKCCGK